MAAKLLLGKPLAERILRELVEEVRELGGRGIVPHLVSVCVGYDDPSLLYMRRQDVAARQIGIEYTIRNLPATIAETQLLEEIDRLNRDPSITGIILQRPVPSHLSEEKLSQSIDPEKDVEGLNPANIGLLVYGSPRVGPCTAMAVYMLLEEAGISLKGKEVVVVGHSETVGKPIALLLLQSPLESATPTICHIGTQDLQSHTRRADILIVAAGKPGLVRGNMIKPGAVVVDVGINRVAETNPKGKPVLGPDGSPRYRTVGDVIFEEASKLCSWITPVPGGVGPMTVAMLMKNTVECAKKSRGN